jgi:ADP-heptose:LPS heptosyltransferase
VILALRALGLGDLLTAVPALRAVRRHFAGSELLLAAPRPLEPLVHRFGLADRLFAVPSAVNTPPEHLPNPPEPAEVAVNLHGKGPQSTRALRTLRPATLWAYGEPGAPRFDPDEHEVDRWCRLVGAYGCQPRRDDLYLSGVDDERTGSAVIHPGAADASRRWPAERFAAVARGLADWGLPVRVSAGPGERGLATEVVTRAGLPPWTVAADMDLTGLTDLVAASPLVVCGDTGIAHLATACRTPSVVLFGPQPPSRWGPPADPRHRVFWSQHDQAFPSGPHPALLWVRPSDVLAAADEVLEGSRQRLA